jgi:hypothetical protein
MSADEASAVAAPVDEAKKAVTRYVVMIEQPAAEGDGATSWKVVSQEEAWSAPAAIRAVVEKLDGTIDAMYVAVPTSSFQPKHVTSQRAFKLA